MRLELGDGCFLFCCPRVRSFKSSCFAHFCFSPPFCFTSPPLLCYHPYCFAFIVASIAIHESGAFLRSSVDGPQSHISIWWLVEKYMWIMNKFSYIWPRTTSSSRFTVCRFLEDTIRWLSYHTKQITWLALSLVLPFSVGFDLHS